MSLTTFKLIDKHIDLLDSYKLYLNTQEPSKQEHHFASAPLTYLNRDHWSFDMPPHKAIDRLVYLYPRTDEYDPLLCELAKTLFESRVPELKNKDFEVTRTGTHYYPPKGWMGWHTNADQNYWTLYITYTSQEGTSFFRYYDKDTDTIKTSYDGEGITCRIFKINQEKDNLFTHCVYTDVDRWSFGFQVKNKQGNKQ